MNLNEIKNNVIKTALKKLNTHKSMGSNTPLSILEVAELLDIVSGKAENANVEPIALVGPVHLN
ncbi:MAG: hypothetical protein WDZ35_04560 [Crocinitomicaceae bacterium]